MTSSRTLLILALLGSLAQGADRLPAQRFETSGTDPSVDAHGRCPDCDVLFVSIDTLRPDHLGCYGYAEPTSPSIDAFCRDALVFDDALAHAPSTLPSHASIFTSWLPAHHGAKASDRLPLPMEALTLAEVLHASGWTTAAFTDAAQMSRRWQLDQGFELYDQQSVSAHLMNTFAERVEQGIEWVERTEAERWFLFLHTYEVHHPYTPDPNTIRLLSRRNPENVTTPIPIRLLRSINNGRERLTAPLLRDIVLNYDAEIRSMDAGFGRLIGWLQDTGRYDDTLVVFTSDHGEEFAEHGQVGWHSHTLYDELLRVPLVIRLPGGAGGGSRSSHPARGIDLMPTILDALAVPIPGTARGISLLEALGGDPLPEDPVLVAEKDRSQVRPPTAIRTRRWKLYSGQLFDLLVDPGETVDRADRYPGLVAALAARLREQIDAQPPPVTESIELDPQLREQLRSLGYIQ